MMSTDVSLKLDTQYIFHPKLGPHGLTQEQIGELEPRVGKILQEIAEERARGEHGFRELPHKKPQLDEIKQMVAELHDFAENLLVLGIGGSALGNIALQTALNPSTYNLMPRTLRGGPRLFVLDNIDPVHFEAVMQVIGDDWSETLVNVITKSGETAETSAQFLIVRDRLIHALGKDEFMNNLIVTTDTEKGTMRGIAEREGYRSLIMPDDVGGRFSVLSSVGLFSALMCGIDIDELLAGAAEMDQVVSDPNPLTNPAARIAMIHYLYDQSGKPMHVMMPYSQQLRDLADWYRQLWAESLGKIRGNDNENVGPTPIKALGATDQHSQLQLYREGPNDKVFTLLEVGEFECDSIIPQAFEDVETLNYLGRSSEGTLGGLLAAEKKATQLALRESQRPSLTIHFPEVNARTVGEFIYLYESVIPIMGKLYDINPYDQPAVELGKQLTFHFMGLKDYEEPPIDIDD
ncbi:MAG: glucose-6-phosphate isomerase [Planctomycetota bacterium]|nr:MAG: glucose-6-phosphate isomerase [Planctomycetota bacterium]